MTKTIIKPLMVCGLLAVLSSCATSSVVGGKKADLVIIGTPVHVTSLYGGVVIDAVEGNPNQIEETAAAVQFKIEKILRGDFIKMKVGGLTKQQQAMAAVKKGKVLQLLTLDFKDPNEEVEKPWITVAVKNAYRSFNILDWENPGEEKFKLYFQAIPERPGSYTLLTQEPLR